MLNLTRILLLFTETAMPRQQLIQIVIYLAMISIQPLAEIRDNNIVYVPLCEIFHLCCHMVTLRVRYSFIIMEVVSPSLPLSLGRISIGIIEDWKHNVSAEIVLYEHDILIAEIRCSEINLFTYVF